jgi:hypothetical protein
MWFSAMLKIAVTVSDAASSVWRTVVVFEVDDDWAAATMKALALGRQREQHYANADGASVEHRLLAVETLDRLGEAISDGREVYFESRGAREDELLSMAPDEIAPAQTGV